MLPAMTKTWGIAALALLALTGCASADAGFEQAWKAQYPNANMTTAVQHAKDVCSAFKAGTTYRDELAYIQGTTKATDTDARAMVATAAASYCPQYKDLH